GHAVARGAPSRYADAVRARLPDHVHAGRDQRGDAGHDPVRHPRQPDLLHRRLYPLCAVWWLAVHDLRRGLLLVPEDDRLGKLHFWMTFIFFNLTFGPMHLIGIQGMPRRVAEYAAKFAAWNLFISISAFILGLST